MSIRSALAGSDIACCKAFELVMERTETAAAGDRFVDHASPGHLFDVLPEIADVIRRGSDDLAVVRRFLARDDAEERRLAGAVGPDQADLLAGVELKRRVHEEQLLAVLLRQALNRDHRPAATCFRVSASTAVFVLVR